MNAWSVNLRVANFPKKLLLAAYRKAWNGSIQHHQGLPCSERRNFCPRLIVASGWDRVVQENFVTEFYFYRHSLWVTKHGIFLRRTRSFFDGIIEYENILLFDAPQAVASE